MLTRARRQDLSARVCVKRRVSPDRIDRSSVFLSVCRRNPLDEDRVRKTDDESALCGDRGLAHAELVGTVCLDHRGPSVSDLADICLIDGDHLVFSEGVGPVLPSVHRDLDTSVIFISLRDLHAGPDGRRGDQHDRKKNDLSFFQFKTAPFPDDLRGSKLLHSCFGASD